VESRTTIFALICPAKYIDSEEESGIGAFPGGTALPLAPRPPPRLLELDCEVVTEVVVVFH